MRCIFFGAAVLYLAQLTLPFAWKITSVAVLIILFSALGLFRLADLYRYRSRSAAVVESP